MVGIVYYKFRGALLHPNDSLLEMIGLDRGEFEATRREWPALISTDSRTVDDREWETVRSKGYAGPADVSLLHKGGHNVPATIYRANVQAGRHESGIAFVMDARPHPGPSEKELLERQRIAGVLHDQLQQLVAAARMKIGVMRRRASEDVLIESLKQSEALLEKALDASKSLVAELTSPLGGAGLPAAKATPTAPEGSTAASQSSPAGQLKDKGSLPPPRALRVLVADDHKLFREGLICLLLQQPRFVVVGESADGQEAVDLARKLRPDILIADVSMPRMDGVQVTSLLSRELPKLKIVGLSMHDRAEVADAMRRAGAAAYCGKDEPIETLVDILMRVSAPDEFGPVSAL